MSDKPIKPTKWRDPAGNVYSVEKSIKTGRFIVIRTNPGGNRKAAKQFETVGSAAHVQKVLDGIARQADWKEVTG